MIGIWLEYEEFTSITTQAALQAAPSCEGRLEMTSPFPWGRCRLEKRLRKKLDGNQMWLQKWRI